MAPLLTASCRGDGKGEVAPGGGGLEDARCGSGERVGAGEDGAEEAPGEVGGGVGGRRVEAGETREGWEEVGDWAGDGGGGRRNGGGRRREEEEEDREGQDDYNAGAFPHWSESSVSGDTREALEKSSWSLLTVGQGSGFFFLKKKSFQLPY